MVTGHTGFKGGWLCHMLKLAGAEVTGYSLAPAETTSLHNIAKIDDGLKSIFEDIRDIENLQQAFVDTRPEVVIHMAAQPLVREGYRSPRETYEVNTMGTINILECIRQSDTVKSAIIVTTDKVYKNNEWLWGYRENERLDGYDPYSNSKSCADLATWSYQRSFFEEGNVAISTVRAGNVIGGGDFAKDRIVPDCVRAVSGGEKILVRNPYSARPYQHVLEPLTGYLQLAQQQYQDNAKADCYNIGPDEQDCLTTEQLVTLFCQAWGDEADWYTMEQEEAHEARYLKLDCSKIKAQLGWHPCWSIERAVQKTVAWHKAYLNNENMQQIMTKQIQEYFEELAYV